jgi:cyclopropane fatty-acyl-phospholipid synthase-like methyltransferase
MSDRVARAVRRAYAASPLGTRVHLLGRWWTCPFPAVADAVPESGAILDAGCGHGLFTLYLAAQHPARVLTGVDIDERKLPEARAAADRLGVSDRVSFGVVPHDWRPGAIDDLPTPPAGWDAIVEVDMLYLVGLDAARTWLRAAAGALAPGGRLVVKELDTQPAWKHRVSRLQEQVATRVLHITRGEQLELVPRADVEAVLRAEGLAVDGRRLDRGRLHPHYVVTGTRAR